MIKYKNSKYNYETRDGKLVKATVIIDWLFVVDISYDSKEFYGKLFLLFLEELTDLQLFLEKNENLDEIKLKLHCIKGSSVNLGFNLLSCYCYYVMELIKEKKVKYSKKFRNELLNDVNEIKILISDDFKNNLNKNLH